jgi:hypothetical protein
LHRLEGLGTTIRSDDKLAVHFLRPRDEHDFPWIFQRFTDDTSHDCVVDDDQEVDVADVDQKSPHAVKASFEDDDWSIELDKYAW